MKKIFYSLAILGLASVFFIPFTSNGSTVLLDGIYDCKSTEEPFYIDYSFDLQQPMKPFEARAFIFDICLDREKQSLDVFISSDYYRDGKMTIKIPREDFNPLKSSCEDDVFQIERSGKFTPYEEIKTVDFREITFPIMSNDYQITIFAENPENTRLCSEKFIETPQQSAKVNIQMEDSEKPDAVRPKFQQDNGIPAQKVLCEEGLELILKSSDDSYACVLPKTVEKLVTRGWGISPSQKIQVGDMGCTMTAQAWRQHFIMVSVFNLDKINSIDTNDLDVYVNGKKIKPIHTDFRDSEISPGEPVFLRIMYEEGDYLDHVEEFKIVKVVGPSNTGWDFWVC